MGPLASAFLCPAHCRAIWKNRTMRRVLLVCSLALTAFPLLAPPIARGGYPVYRGGGFGFGLGFFAPSYYGYPLDDTTAGYYGGGRYREYYSYGRRFGWANCS